MLSIIDLTYRCPHRNKKNLYKTRYPHKKVWKCATCHEEYSVLPYAKPLDDDEESDANRTDQRSDDTVSNESLARPFDPYLKWLGIRTLQHPPNHYRLLGLENFESDELVIASAADRQMAHVRSFQLGKNGTKCSEILRDLVVAKNCLIICESREEYEKLLRFELAHQTRLGVEASMQTQSTADVDRQATSTEHGNASGIVEGPLNPKFNFLSRRKTKGTRRRSRKIELIGHILAPLLGLTVGWLILTKIRPEIFNFHDTKIAADENHSADGSPKASISAPPSLVREDKAEKIRNGESLVNPVPENVSVNANASSQSPAPVVQKPSPHLPPKHEDVVANSVPSYSNVRLKDNSEVPAAYSIKVRFTKLKESARADSGVSEVRNLARQCLKLLDDAKTENDPPLAKQISELALISARKSNDQSLIRLATLAVLSAASMKQEAGGKPDE